MHNVNQSKLTLACTHQSLLRDQEKCAELHLWMLVCHWFQTVRDPVKNLGYAINHYREVVVNREKTAEMRVITRVPTPEITRESAGPK